MSSFLLRGWILPAHLLRVEEVVEPRSAHCPCGCGEMVRIGEDRTERLDFVTAQRQFLVTMRPKYACRACEQGVVQMPARRARRPPTLRQVIRRSARGGPR